MNKIALKVNGGTIISEIVDDINYPGITTYFVPDDDNYEDTLFESRMEQPQGEEVRILVWSQKSNEDYTHEIKLED